MPTRPTLVLDEKTASILLPTLRKDLLARASTLAGSVAAFLDAKSTLDDDDLEKALSKLDQAAEDYLERRNLVLSIEEVLS